MRRFFDELIYPDQPCRPMNAATLGITEPAEAEQANRLMTPAPLRTHTDVSRLQGEPRSGPRFYVRVGYNGRLFEKTARLAAAEGWTVSTIAGGHDLQTANPEDVTDAIARVVAQCSRA